MKMLFSLALLCALTAVGYGQNGIIGSGFANGWNNPDDAISFDQGFGNSRIKILAPNGTGNQYFRFVKFWNFNNTEFGPSSCTDQDLTSDVNVQINNMPSACGGAFYINCPSTNDNYVFKSNDPDGDDIIYFRVQGPIREITTVSAPANVYDNQPATITATTDDVLSAGQKVFLRYTTDGFASSSIIEMTASPGFAAPQDYTAEIPGLAEGTTVTYYTLTAGDEPTPAEADWYTINGNTNGGANYSYTVQMALPIEIASFDGESLVAEIQLKWETASEINFDYFEVLKLKGSDWQALGKVKSHSNSREGATYEFSDVNPSAGANIYRLKNIDLDGSYEYSKAISVEHRSSTIKVYPTVAQDHVMISGTTAGDIAYILEATGKLLTKASLGDSSNGISIAGINSGVYILQITDQHGEIKHTEKLIKL